MTTPIHDLYIQSLKPEARPEGQRLELLRHSDHLLRRFGLADILRLDADAERAEAIQEIADELWALIRGSVDFHWQDLRSGSPTHGERFELRCVEPTLVLVPFGVSFSIRAKHGPAELIRFATHEDWTKDG